MHRNEVNSKLDYLASIGYSPILLAGVRLLFDFGLRCSDMLNIRRSDITLEGKIIVKQGKGSNVLICNLGADAHIWDDYRRGLHCDLSVYSYLYVYRLMKKCNLQLPAVKGANASVTHLGRKMVANEIYSQTKSIEAVKQALGHVSEGSSLFYINQEEDVMKKKPQSIITNPSVSVGNLKVTNRKSNSVISVPKIKGKKPKV
jgi:integrase